MRLSIVGLLLGMLIPMPGISAEDEPAVLLVVDRALLLLSDLAGQEVTLYHAFENELLVRATPAGRRMVEHQGLSYRVLGDDPEREAYWILPHRQNVPSWPQIPATDVVYRAEDALLVRGLSEDWGVDLAVPLRKNRWDLSALARAPAAVTAAARNDSMVAALAAMVDPDTIRWMIQSLQNFGTRYAGASNRDSVAGWIREQFLRMGYTEVSLQEFTYNGLKQHNVLAVLEGSNPLSSPIVVGGHHDSNSSGDRMVSAPGADDNASGTAAVLEIARVIKSSGYQPEVPIRFMTFAAEELGLWGSWLDASTARLSGQEIRLMVNHDMIAHTLSAPTASSVDLNYYSGAAGYRDLAMQAVRDFTVLTPRIGSLNSGGSDSYPYWTYGYPAIYFEERDFSPYYHSPQDVLANITIDYCAEIIRASLATVLRVSFIPGAVHNLVVRDRGDGTSLLLSWSAVREADLAGYRVELSDGQRDTSIVTPDTVLVVGDLAPGLPVTVVVGAEDLDGNRGLPAQGRGTPKLWPLAPAGAQATPEWHRVVLSWERNLELDLKGYTVYRSDAIGGTALALTPEPIQDTVYIDSTAASGTFYYYTVRAVDNTNNEGAASATMRSRVVSLDGGILLVDATADGPSPPPANAPDSLHDAFYQRLLSGYEPDLCDLTQLDLAMLGAYSTVVWYEDDITNFARGFSHRDEVARYLEYGGRFLYGGFRPSRVFSNFAAFTADFLPGDYLYEYLRIRRIEFPLTSPGMNAARATQVGYEDVLVDPLKTPPVQNGHLRNIEAIYAAEGALEVYSFDSILDTTGVLRGKPIAVQSLGSPFRTVVLSFPLAYMDEEDARVLVHHILSDVFSEVASVDAPPAGVPVQFALAQNYPNPFNPSTTIRFDLPREAEVSLVAYDLLGRELAVVYRASAPAGRHEVLWDASGLASGVYFLRFEARSGGGVRLFSSTRKVLLLQ